MRSLTPPPNGAAGMTLIEVLVALLIFSFGLLGFVGLQVRATQYSVSAENSNRAALFANEMVTTIQLAGSPFAMPASSAIAAWQSRVTTATSGGLPNSSATVQAFGSDGATITIQWQPPAAAASATDRNRYVTQVIVPRLP